MNIAQIILQIFEHPVDDDEHPSFKVKQEKTPFLIFPTIVSQHFVPRTHSSLSLVGVFSS